MGKSVNYQTAHLTKTKVKVRKTLPGVWLMLFGSCGLTDIKLGPLKKEVKRSMIIKESINERQKKDKLP